MPINYFNMEYQDRVVKRNGTEETFSFDKILKRITRLGNKELCINYTALVRKIVDRLYDGIHTEKIDELMAQQCASLITTHPDYGILASRILISNHHKNTTEDYFEIVSKLFFFKDIHGKQTPMIRKELYTIVKNNKDLIQSMFDFERDYLFDYFGFKTLERAYLQRINGVILERPQHMWMRVALAIHKMDMKKVQTTYNMMSQKYFIHATPTLFNAGTPRQQMSSCYLLAMEKDSIDGIYSTLTDCAKISKWAGGIGLHIHNIRATGSHIRGTNGISNGIVPMLKAFNATARYVDQGGGKRNGSFAIYLEPWHKDIREFLELKKNHGDEEQRARDLFYALWIPDLFMERVERGEKWTLMCPDQCHGLCDVYGDDFNALYTKYEQQGYGVEINARDLWFKILDSQIETGTPYMLYKDACNKKSNQKNLGTIKSSNLCTEIVEYSDEKESAVCNLASLGLPKFVEQRKHNIKTATIYTKANCIYCTMAKKLLEQNSITYHEIPVTEENIDDFKIKFMKLHSIDNLTFPQIINDETTECIGGYDSLMSLVRPQINYEKLHNATKIVTENLDKIIDINYYPTDKTRTSNMRNRPIGIGVQGLADVFMLLNVPFDSEEARAENIKIFETIYHGALEASVERSIKLGPYATHIGSPANKGKLSFDLWGDNVKFSGLYDWDILRERVKKHGMRNSLLVAPMPTASTSQILGNNECFEPFTSNIYLRRTLAGEFVIVNKYLLRELVDLDLWTEEIKNQIIIGKGSIQNIKSLPKCLKDKYKIVWEMSMKQIINMAAARAPFIDQSMSMNLWMNNPSYKKLTAMHMYSFKRGLKTGMYYLRTKAKAAPQQFTIDPTAKTNRNSDSDDEGCVMCSA